MCLADGQRALQVSSGFSVSTCSQEQLAKIVQEGRGLRMIGPEYGFHNSQSLLIRFSCIVEPGALAIDLPQVVQDARQIQVLGSSFLAPDLSGSAVRLLSIS